MRQTASDVTRLNELWESQDVLTTKLLAAEPKSLKGMLALSGAMVGALAFYALPSGRPDPTDWEAKLLLKAETTIAEAEQFAGTPPASIPDADDPHVALSAEWVARKAEHDITGRQWDERYEQTPPEERQGMTDDECQESYDRLWCVGEKIAETPANTLFGVLAKMRCFAEIHPDIFERDAPATDDRLMQGVMAGLERLAEGDAR